MSKKLLLSVQLNRETQRPEAETLLGLRFSSSSSIIDLLDIL